MIALKLVVVVPEYLRWLETVADSNDKVYTRLALHVVRVLHRKSDLRSEQAVVLSRCTPPSRSRGGSTWHFSR